MILHPGQFDSSFPVQMLWIGLPSLYLLILSFFGAKD
jgi:hypothetical protein